MLTASPKVLGQMTQQPGSRSGERVPKFIRTDTVKLKNKKDTRALHIEKFKTVYSTDKLKNIYTGLVVCYWQEGKEYKRDVFHEDDLVLVPKIG